MNEMGMEQKLEMMSKREVLCNFRQKKKKQIDKKVKIGRGLKISDCES